MEQGDPAGMPVILLHGYTDSWLSFEKVLSFLPGNMHVFAISQRGHGNSISRSDRYLPADFASDIAAFIHSKRLGPVVIVGHSMGGIVAQQFVLDYPQLTKALVIVDSDANFKSNPGLEEFFKEVSRLTEPVSYRFADEFQKSTLAIPIDSAYYRLLVNESCKVSVSVWKAALAGILETDLRSRLMEINKPTLLFWGDKDAICLKEGQQFLTANIKNSTLLVYEGVGHALHWEAPQRFANDLTTFINQLK